MYFMNNNYQIHIPPGMLLRVIEAKQNSIMIYDKLLTMTSDQENIGLIRVILQDEINHLNGFTNLYHNLFGGQLNLSDPVTPYVISFLSGIKSAVVHELNNYYFYNNVSFTDQNQKVRHAFIRALADENRHAISFNYIYTKSLEN